MLPTTMAGPPGNAADPLPARGSSRRARRRSTRTKTLLTLLALLVLCLGAAVLAGCSFSAPTWRGPRTGHFDGERFVNQDPTPHQGPGSLLKWLLNRDKGPWRDWTPAPPAAPPASRVGPGELRVTFVNHATVLVQMDGLNLLTDPVWSERTSPVSWAGPKRHRPPGLRLEDLPPIDAVLVSHNHYDHLDVPTLRQLAARHRPRVFAGLGNRALFEREGIGRGEDLDWWQAVELAPGVTLTCVPAQHFSGRGLTDRDGTLWAGFVVSGPAGHVYFAGDTGFGPHFQQIRDRFGAVRLALLPIGAYRPRWFMRHVHMDPAEAVRAHVALQAGTSLGIHFGTFPLADDGQDEPVTALRAALQALPQPGPRFWVLDHGEARDVPETVERQAAVGM